MKGIKTTKEDIYDILKMREKGLSLRSIAKNTGISPATIYRIVKENKFYDGPGAKSLEKKAVVEVEPKAAAVPSVPHVTTPERNGTPARLPAPAPSAHVDSVAILKKLPSRLLLKELHDRGYRVEKEGLFVIEKKKVLLNDIINEA